MTQSEWDSESQSNFKVVSALSASGGPTAEICHLVQLSVWITIGDGWLSLGLKLNRWSRPPDFEQRPSAIHTTDLSLHLAKSSVVAPFHKHTAPTTLPAVSLISWWSCLAWSPPLETWMALCLPLTNRMLQKWCYITFKVSFYLGLLESWSWWNSDQLAGARADANLLMQTKTTDTIHWLRLTY